MRVVLLHKRLVIFIVYCLIKHLLSSAAVITSIVALWFKHIYWIEQQA